MTHFAELKLNHTVLEVGTGSGYQAAILARLVRKVCTIEIIPSLGEAAAQLLRSLGYENVSVKVGDGYHGPHLLRDLIVGLVGGEPQGSPYAR